VSWFFAATAGLVLAVVLGLAVQPPLETAAPPWLSLGFFRSPSPRPGCVELAFAFLTCLPKSRRFSVFFPGAGVRAAGRFPSPSSVRLRRRGSFSQFPPQAHRVPLGRVSISVLPPQAELSVFPPRKIWFTLIHLLLRVFVPLNFLFRPGAAVPSCRMPELCFRFSVVSGLQLVNQFTRPLCSVQPCHNLEAAVMSLVD
jgi:hypothetical protein